MEPSASSAFTAPPPVGGLGNFKGVMLCNRPTDEPTRAMGGGGDGDFQPAFKPTISATEGEPLGINPCKKFEKSDVKSCGPSAALRRHVRWLRELQQQMKEERDQVEDDDRAALDRKEKMKVVFEKQRETVRQMMADRDNVQKDHLETALAPKPKASAAKAKAKPLWAMTVQEKDEFEEDEAEDLINFAENLDYDKYVGDLEFRQNLEALKDRAGKLQKVQDAFKDQLVQDLNGPADDERSTSAGGSCRDLEDGIEGSQLGDCVSESGRSRRSRRLDGVRADGRDEWDCSTACGDDRPVIDDRTKDAVDRILENCPAMKGVHSKDSLSKIIEREAKNRQPELNGSQRLNEHMRKEGEASVAPVIVASEDTQNKLHKPIDPSQLPYLYRSPAV